MVCLTAVASTIASTIAVKQTIIKEDISSPDYMTYYTLWCTPSPPLIVIFRPGYEPRLQLAYCNRHSQYHTCWLGLLAWEPRQNNRRMDTFMTRLVQPLATPSGAGACGQDYHQLRQLPRSFNAAICISRKILTSFGSWLKTCKYQGQGGR